MGISLARKNLFSEKPKLYVSILGVALSILVILAPIGVYFGSIYPSRALPEKSGADIWIVQEGSGDLFHTRSVLDNGYSETLKELPNIRDASPVINNPTRVNINEEDVTAAVLGFDTETKLGSPWKMYEGSENISQGELIIDRTLAYIYDVEVGDNILIADESFEVVGISLDTNVLVFQYIFISLDDARRIFDHDTFVNYYLVSSDPSASDQIKDQLANIVPNSQIKTAEEIADSNQKVIEDSFLPIIILLVLIGLFVGTTVTGLTIYSLTTSKSREYGVLKAIGVNNINLYKIVFTQTIITSFSGYIAGGALFFLIEYITFLSYPQVNFALPQITFAAVFVLTIIMSLLAAFIPIFKINSLDPADVFRR